MQLSRKNRLERAARYESEVLAAAMELVRGEIVLERESVLSLGRYSGMLVDRSRTVVGFRDGIEATMFFPRSRLTATMLRWQYTSDLRDGRAR